MTNPLRQKAEEVWCKIFKQDKFYYLYSADCNNQLSMITEALETVRRETIEECAKVAEAKGIGGDYKDCPAAWINSASKIIAEAIRKLGEGKGL